MDDSQHLVEERRAAIRALIQYDPDGIAAMIESADSLEALLKAVRQLAHLVTVLAALIRTERK